MKNLWGSGDLLNKDFKTYSYGIKNDWYLIEFEWKLQKAQVECLFDANVLTETEKEDLNQAIEKLSMEYTLDNYNSAPTETACFEDIHSFVEFKLCETTGNTGKKIHTGRSRNDQVATLIKLFLNAKSLQLETTINDIIYSLTNLVHKYSNTPMPITTHFQQAALGSIGHYLEMRIKELELSKADLLNYKIKLMKECPLGSGACVGSSIPLDRNILAKNLGFEKPSTNSLYSTSNRDEILDFSFFLAKLSLHIQNFISELITWSNQNFDWIKLPNEFCTGSSMMPNKLNPDALELLRSDLKKIIAWPSSLLLQLSSLPSGYSRDLQTIKDDCFQYINRSIQLFSIFKLIVDKIKFKTKEINHSLNLGYIDATLEMEKLIKNGYSLREAHETIAKKSQGKTKGSFCEGNFSEYLNKYKTIGSPYTDRKLKKSKSSPVLEKKNSELDREQS